MEIEREELSRISSAPWFEAMKNVDVDIIGLGGIGSYVCFVLSRLGVKSMNIFDGDVIEKVNMTGQLFPMSSIGSTKSKTMGDFVKQYSNFSVNSYGHFLFDEYPMKKIVICAVDSMEVRKNAFNTWKKFNLTPEGTLIDKNSIFIDGRLAAESLQILAVDSVEDITMYEKDYLFDDSEADEVICSYKQTTYSAMLIGGLIGNIVVNFVYNNTIGKFRTLPFYTSYECETMKIERTF